jgi:hypothetical protein
MRLMAAEEPRRADVVLNSPLIKSAVDVAAVRQRVDAKRQQEQQQQQQPALL